VVRSISQGLALRPRDFDLTLPAAREKGPALEEDELVLVAFPVYGGRLPSLARDIFDKLPSGKRLAAAVVVYGNRAYDDALLELYDLCCHKGWEVLAAGAFVGEHSYSQVMGRNRPDAADEEIARCFGLGIRQTLFGDKSLSEKALLGKAKRPYRPHPSKLAITPSTNNRRCVSCLLCVRSCPTGAFVNNEPRTIDSPRCILCGACIKLCPEKAKHFDDDDFCDDMAALAAANLDRKEPGTFLP
jgi:ferredoxin